MLEVNEALEPSHLTKLLASSEVTGGRSVLDVARRPVGMGQVASCWELTLTVEGRDRPTTIVAKVPSDDPTSFATASGQRLYEREVRFYESIAATVSIRTPSCYYSAFDRDSGRFLLLLESLAPAAPCDQLEGLTPDRATLAVRELAGLHAPHWGAAPAQVAFIDEVAESLRPLYLEVVPALFSMFLERYGDALTAEARELVEWLCPRLGAYMGGHSGPTTIIHGDFRTDNLLFDGRGGEVPLTTVDWQTLGHGPGSMDLAYLLTTSLDTSTRRTEERRLLDIYLDRLGELGVTGYPEGQLAEDYAFHTFQGVVMLVCSAVIVERTERGDAMFLSMIERCARAVEDHDARRLLAA